MNEKIDNTNKTNKTNKTEYKIVQCDKCGKTLGRVLAKIKSNQIYDCRDCRIRNIYNPETEKCETKDIPIRATSSGFRFW